MGERSRREWLNTAARALMAAPAVALAAPSGTAQTAAPVGAQAEGLPAPPKQHPDVLRALVERLGHGFDIGLYQRALAIGYDALLEEQLHPDDLSDPVSDIVDQALPPLAMTSKQLLDTYGLLSGIPLASLQVAAILRAIGSTRRLFERVVGVWGDHFHVGVGNVQVAHFKVTDDRDVVRAHALGSFAGMLRASAESAAMLTYLDNTSNTVAGPQENYARELLELHTLGVDGGYTEQDVKEVARCFTGWGVETLLSPNYGQFLFRYFLHDLGAKAPLGLQLTPLAGKSDGVAVLDLLAAHPSTERTVSRKLVTRLLSYEAPAPVLRRVRRAFRETGGDLRAMTRETLRYESLVAAEPWTARKFKRPFHFATGLLRSLGAQVDDAGPLLERLRTLGQAPFEWGPPNGYPDSLGAWGSNLLPRWEFATDLMNGAIEGVAVPVPQLLQQLGLPAKDDFVAVLDLFLTGGRMDPQDAAAVQGYLDELPTLDDTAVRDAVALAASTPSYQLY